MLPFISNPVVLVAVGVGATGWVVYKMFSDKDDQEDGSKPYFEPYDDEDLAVETTVMEPPETVKLTVEKTVNPSVKEPYFMAVIDDSNDEPEYIETVSEEDQKKEIIRLAMLELGKRSAAARRKNKKPK